MALLNAALMPELGLPGGVPFGRPLRRQPWRMPAMSAKRVSLKRGMELKEHCPLGMLLSAEAK
jgi:hypothetical protein